jgi:general secretion pathway protein E
MTARTFSLEYVLDLLEHAQALSAEQRRDIEVHAQQQRARVLRELFGTLDDAESARYAVSPVELVASFKFSTADNTPVDDEFIAERIADDAGLPFYKVDPLELDMALITQTFSRPFAVRHVALPLRREAEGLTVVVENPFDLELTENLPRIVGCPVLLTVAAKGQIIKAITEVYGFKRSVQAAAHDLHNKEDPGQQLQNFEQLVHLKHVGEIEHTDRHIVNAVDFLLNNAFDQRASDIHIEPRREDSQVRLRIDGVLHDTYVVPHSVHPAFVSRIKMLARLDIAEKRRPQDGRIKTQLGEKEIELRVSTLPVAFGEKVVIRIFDPDVLLQSLADLGFYPTDLVTFQGWITRPYGIVLITGPTGSGKTTTLYTTLKELARPDVNITTIEDPIEMVTDTFNQVAVQPKIDITFASALRTILRQDPDIIMIGEIRDHETAEMAIQASLTGHLVFSTLHTNDTASTITRLLDLGVEPFQLTSSLAGIMAQRLVRKICKDCKEPVTLSVDQLAALGMHGASVKAFQGAGCGTCRGTGYYGRTGIFEMMTLTPALRALLKPGVDSRDIALQAQKDGMVALKECAVRKLVDGMTTFEEIIRVTGA